MKAFLSLCLAVLVATTVKGVDPGRSPQITLSCDKDSWVVAHFNPAGTPVLKNSLQVTIKNTLSEIKIFTSYGTFLPFIKMEDGKVITFSFSGRDHTCLPGQSEFITLKPGKVKTLAVDIFLIQMGDQSTLWYECPTGDCYSCKSIHGQYKLGIKYRLQPNFFDGFNDPKRESYHQPWDESQLIWNGTVDSNLIPLAVRMD